LINKVYGDRPENNFIIARSGRHRLLKDGYFLICIINAGKAKKRGSVFIQKQAAKISQEIRFHLTALWQKCGPCPGRLLSRTIVGDFTDASSAESYLKANSPTGNWPYLFFYA
jgi:hypothetical protein